MPKSKNASTKRAVDILHMLSHAFRIGKDHDHHVPVMTTCLGFSTQCGFSSLTHLTRQLLEERQHQKIPEALLCRLQAATSPTCLLKVRDNNLIISSLD